MPVAGRKPKEGPKRNRMPAVHDWVEVEDRPFRGRVPVKLPAKRQVVGRDGTFDVPLLGLTKAWWATVRAMPHCVLWQESDWQFALMTALIADAAYRGTPGAAAELRQREKVLGTTVDARRDLRIRYVDKLDAKTSTKRPEPATVTSLAEHRRRLLDDAD